MEAFQNGVVGLIAFLNQAKNANVECVFVIRQNRVMEEKIVMKIHQLKYLIARLMVDGHVIIY
jgi:hypothetical protein